MSEERDKVQKIRENFKELEKQISQETDLKELFDLWRNAHASEVDEIKEQMKAKASINEDDKKIFETELYHSKSRINGIKHKNTISSHFVQFFDRECSCNEPAWEYVLKHAFNMDGCYGTFQPRKDGYKYICLLKEANDSKKVCVKDYEPDIGEKKINEFVMKEKEKHSMLIILNEAFRHFCDKVEKSNPKDFMEETAYMNVNKRGGTSSTVRFDQTAVINYAGKYRKFILKEIDLLSLGNKEVTVFVCGKRDNYFEKLVEKLCKDAVKIKEGIYQYTYTTGSKNKKINFVSITHPSPPAIKKNDKGFQKLADEMLRAFRED